MRIQEERHPNEPWLLWKIGNWTAIDSDLIGSIGIAWLFKENGIWCFMPRITGNQSLFYNAVFFVRYTVSPLQWLQLALIILFQHWWPLLFGIFIGLRVVRRQIFQTGFGYKLNGRLGLLFRLQSDVSAAAGTTGPNTGQATGFNYGTH